MDCFLAYSIVGQGVGSCLLCSKTYLFFHPFIAPCSFSFPLLFPPLAFFSSLLYCPTASSLLPSLLRLLLEGNIYLIFQYFKWRKTKTWIEKQILPTYVSIEKTLGFSSPDLHFQVLNHYSKQTKSSGCILTCFFRQCLNYCTFRIVVLSSFPVVFCPQIQSFYNYI